jgi:peptide/nickel transport system substrate-binding protein
MMASKRLAGPGRFLARVAGKFGLPALAIAFALMLALVPASAQDVLRIPYVADIGSFDPDNGFEIGSVSAINNVYEGLVEYTPGTTKIVGRLAKTWEISPDGLTYTFHLVNGVKFQDGTPFDAAAVVTSFERRKHNKFLLSYFLDNMAAIEAPNSNTVVLKLSRPQPSLLDRLASPYGPKVISPKALAEHAGSDAATGWLTEHAVGTGPFKLTEFKRGERYLLDRNDDYWGAKPFFREIQIPVIPDVAVQILQLQAGQIDAVPIDYPFAQLKSLPPGLQITASPSVNQYDLFFKPGTVLDDPDIRKAVLTAINPALWADDAFYGYAPLSKSIYPNVVLDPVHPLAYPTDFAAARAAITKHGGVELTIGTFSETPSYRRIADLMIAQLARIGVKASSYPLPANAAFALKGDSKAPDVLLTIAGPDAAHPATQVTVFYTADAPVNFYGRVVPDADAIISRAGLLTDIPERNALYEKAGQMYFDAGVAAPLVDVDDVVVHKKGLTDLGLRPVFPPGNIDFATARWAK